MLGNCGARLGLADVFQGPGSIKQGAVKTHLQVD